jgi:thioredoxin 1
VTTIEVTADNFAEVGASADTIVFGFSSLGCKPCAAFASAFERLSERHDDMLFAAVNVEKQPNLADALGVSSVPTVMVVRDRIVLYAQPGALPERIFEGLLDKVCAVDMDDVRRRMASRGAAAVSDRAIAEDEETGAGTGA